MKSLPIILILMAILVPSMLGYVNQAKAADERTQNPPYEYFSF